MADEPISPAPTPGAPGADGLGTIPAVPPMPVPAVKRGRGRPRKPAGLTPPPVAPAAGAPAAPGSESPGNLAPALWTIENCRPIGELPYLVAGFATKWDGWALEDREAEAVAAPLAQVLNALIPQGGKYAAVVALSSTLLAITGMKYRGYREHLAAEEKKKAADNGGRAN